VRLLFLTLIFFVGFFETYGQNIHRWYQDGKVVFQVKESQKLPRSKAGNVEIDEFRFLKSVINDFEIEKVVQLHPGIKDEHLVRTYQVEFSKIEKIDKLVRYLNESNVIEYAEKKELHESFLTPNDQYFVNSFNSGQWALYQIDAPLAWDISTGSSDIVVAITDDAININHPDLVNKVVAGWDAVDNDNDPSPCGGNDGFHGSHVSGIVGAETNNNIGVASIGYNVSIMPVKIGDCNTGSLTSGYDGIIWATDNGADVINMSWGGGGQSTYGQNVCNYAWNQGSILVAAAGNDGTNQQFYPAAYNNVIAVASTTTGDSKSSFSQYGTWVDVSAPGSSILSTDEGTSYQITQGTSMASPLVAGLVGLMISHAPSAPQQEVVNCLLSTCENIDASNSGYIGQLGAGRVNAHQALLCMNQFTYSLDVGVSSILEPLGSICSSSFDPEIVLTNFGGNTITSVDIEYQIDGGPIDVLNWSGNLTQGQSTTITLPNQNLSGGSHTMTVTSVNPNGGTDENNSNDSETNSFEIITNGQIVDLNILTDCYGSEITWMIDEDATGNNVVSGGPYEDVTGGELNVENICLASGCYVFTINDSYGDGMYGSQWTCTVNGDYSMTDQLGATLFEMTAVNSDFGSQTSHNFCVSSNVSLDAGISNITAPQGTICGNSINPIIQLSNYGTTTLTSVEIVYNIGGANQTYNWTGSLNQGANATVNLPTMGVTSGSYTFTAWTQLPNGSGDLNTSNDESSEIFTAFSNSQPLPFSEDFESNSFTTNQWTIDNADGGITWEVVTVAGSAPGDKAAKIDFYNYANGFERDGLQTPPLDFSNYSGVSMTFDHAFRRYNTSSADSMVILVSTDCSNTFERIVAYAEDGTGTFATAATTTVPFDPASGEWCTGTVGANCFTIDLSAYDGQPSVVVRFESFNNGIAGNNLFIDNINIDGTQLNNPPTANYSTSQVLCEGEDINFYDSSLGSPTSWDWDFGDGLGTSTLQNPLYNYISNGTYDVTLVVTNSFGTDTYSQTVTINNTPVVSASSSVPGICEGGSAIINASGGTSYSWDNGAGTGASVNVAPIITTDYTVTGTDANGCFNTDVVTITVNNIPVISITGSQSPSICGTSTGSISVGSTGGGDISWTGPSSNSAGNISLPYTINNLPAGSYNVSFIDNNGCIAEDIQEILSDPNSPSAPVISQGSIIGICPGEQIELTSSYTAGNTWSTSESTQAIITNNIGTYTVFYTDPSGCVSPSTSIEVIANPPLNVTTSGNVTICDGQNTTISANGATSYSWDNGVGMGSSVIVNPSNSTTYTVTGSDVNGCEGQSQVTVIVNSLPIVTTNADLSICQGSNVNLTALGASTYLWDNNVGAGSIVNVAPTNNTAYTVVGTDANGCQGSDQVSITVNPLPSVNITPSLIETSCINTSQAITLTGSPSGGFFTGPGIFGSNFEPASAGVGTHTITYTYTDGNGCTGQNTVVAVVEDCSNISEKMLEGVILSPNPNDGNFNITGLDAQSDYSIVDSRGRIVLQGSVQNTEEEIHVSNIESGTYYLYGVANGSQGTLKIIVTN
jgi:PKD repeat protein